MEGETPMAYQLPELPYAFDALEKAIDAKTMEIHHGKHHNGYVSKLNSAVESHADLQSKSVEDLLRDIQNVPDTIRQAVINNGGGHANHTLFWQIMSGSGGGEPSGDLAGAIQSELGGFAKFQEDFSNAAATRFGSGWAWLVYSKDGRLKVYSTPNQDSPLMQEDQPILGLDVWEHAYYLRYQNKRPDYIKAWWDVVDWKKVADFYDKAKS
jgi:superoxide dismutase, Fe-Mn family